MFDDIVQESMNPGKDLPIAKLIPGANEPDPNYVPSPKRPSAYPTRDRFVSELGRCHIVPDPRKIFKRPSAAILLRYEAIRMELDSYIPALAEEVARLEGLDGTPTQLKNSETRRGFKC